MARGILSRGTSMPAYSRYNSSITPIYYPCTSTQVMVGFRCFLCAIQQNMAQSKDPLDALLETEINSPVGATATMGPVPSGPVGYAAPIPEATEETMVCLRGPCKHYVEIKQRVKHGNTEGTFAPGEEPVMISRYCKVLESDYIELSDEVIWDCNSWVPQDCLVLHSRKTKRDLWCKANSKPWNYQDSLKDEE